MSNTRVDTSDGDNMMDALEIMGMDRKTCQWILGSIDAQGIEGQIAIDTLRQA